MWENAVITKRGPRLEEEEEEEPRKRGKRKPTVIAASSSPSAAVAARCFYLELMMSSEGLKDGREEREGKEDGRGRGRWTLDRPTDRTEHGTMIFGGGGDGKDDDGGKQRKKVEAGAVPVPPVVRTPPPLFGTHSHMAIGDET